MNQTDGATIHVMIVDDDEDIRHTLRFLLEDEGYRVTEATDGEDGYTQLMAALVPHVVLLDILMPKLTGFDVLERLDPQVPHRFIVLTALHRPFSAEEAALLRRWKATLLRKPFDIGAALGVIEDAARHLPRA